ncbi:hypothetical protein [Stieleria mannarensis]|uniref:hypothetical protein n=1 Tax=Stieleria mannarensis TaxID=2755585 RepID=UPI0016014FEE|nr:hypothetical protein [Rhodopirellula sp. JC639]
MGDYGSATRDFRNACDKLGILVGRIPVTTFETVGFRTPQFLDFLSNNSILRGIDGNEKGLILSEILGVHPAIARMRALAITRFAELYLLGHCRNGDPIFLKHSEFGPLTYFGDMSALLTDGRIEIVSTQLDVGEFMLLIAGDRLAVVGRDFHEQARLFGSPRLVIATGVTIDW